MDGGKSNQFFYVQGFFSDSWYQTEKFSGVWLTAVDQFGCSFPLMSMHLAVFCRLVRLPKQSLFLFLLSALVL